MGIIICLAILMCFFFQAEDGIRDLVRSRGLGDVYKRQSAEEAENVEVVDEVKRSINGFYELCRNEDYRVGPVSYTHLTLPTSDLV